MLFCYPDLLSMRTRLFTIVAVLALAALLACGIPGAPQPPSLELPRTVGNLQAVRKGDKVTLTWTTPHETTDRKRIKHLGVTGICRAVDRVAVVECVERVGALPPEHTPLQAAASFTYTLPKQLQETHASGFATYAVEVENGRGKSAGLSNQVTVPLAPTLPPPSRLSAKVTAEGVQITGSGERGPTPGALTAYHLYRRIQGGKEAVDLGEPSMIEAMGRAYGVQFLDRNAEWEKTYLYKVAAVTVETVQGKDEQIEGEDSTEIEVFVHDVFPPAVPAGLQAVSSGTPQQPFIDLSWAPDSESDLAGYNVYRHEEGAAPVKINTDVVKAPTYRDTAVEAGRRYWYSVSAVDVRGNQSEKSAETSEAVQQ
jgi:hypothetical protein